MTPACPACTAPDLQQVSKIELQCSYCRSTFSGKPLICPACGWINTEGSELCHDCDEPMNVISQVLSRQDPLGEPQWLRRVRAQATEIKSEEEAASRKRFELLEEIDHRREKAQMNEMEIRKERDKGIFFAVLVIFIVVVIIFVVLFLLQGPSGV